MRSILQLERAGKLSNLRLVLRSRYMLIPDLRIPRSDAQNRVLASENSMVG